MTGVTVYRVRQSRNHPKRYVRAAWYGRTWQAEWDDCMWAPRAYTEAGVRRKAARQMRWSPRHVALNYDVHVWVRTWITRREGYLRLFPWQVER